MDSWQKALLKYASRLEEEIDQKRFKLKQKLGWVHPPIIQAYRGYTNGQTLYARGRVLEAEGLEVPEQDVSVWQNILRMYHRYESDEIPQAPIHYSFGHHSGEISCNTEGFFELDLKPENIPPLNDKKWQTIELKLLEKYHEEQSDKPVQAEIQAPLPTNTFGIISDIDDTILVSKATEFLEKLRILLLNNAKSRMPFEGVASFYKALEAGTNGNAQNPFFYVSGSSWNLYDLFDRFCAINDLPKGVFLLRELGISEDQLFRNSTNDHKIKEISRVMDCFSHLSFVLIGDSGQKDPEIYHELSRKYPKRIKAIYIRDVLPDKDDKREAEVQKIAEEVAKNRVEMVLVKDSMEAAQHAVKLGLIRDSVLSKIEEETYEDKHMPSDISQLLGLDKLGLDKLF